MAQRSKKPLPVVSIILTVFERETFLRKAIESVLAQTFSDFEIIVTDDSNKASIRQNCELFQAGGRLRYRSNGKQLGAPLNIRAAIEEAKGKYIAILNDDDYWEPTFLENLVAPLEANPSCAVAFSDHWIMDETGTIDVPETEANSVLYGRSALPEGPVGDPAALILFKNGVPLAMASVLRKSALPLDVLTKEVSGAYDFWISCALASTGGEFYFVKDRLTRYRLHPQMETGRRSADKYLNQVFITAEMLKRGWFPHYRRHLRQRHAGALFRVGRDLADFGKAKEARNYFVRSFFAYPSWKPAVAWVLSVLPSSIQSAAKFTKPAA